MVGIAVAIFGLIIVLIGVTVFTNSSTTKNQASALQTSGLNGTVTDARIFIAVDVTNGPSTPPTARDLELTYQGADGTSHTGTTRHYPTISLSIYQQDGWYSDFDTKPQLLGQQVRYAAESPQRVELASELPAQADAGWNIGHFFALAFGGVGVIILVSGIITVLRAKP